jgi:type IV pilus assembly protein PilC
MTARQIAKWALIGWLTLIVIQILLGSQGIETGLPLPGISTIFFIAAFAGHIYDWTRSRSEGEDRVLFLLEFADLLRLGIGPSEALTKLVSIRSSQYSHRFTEFAQSLQDVSMRVNSGESLEGVFQEVRGVPDHWGSYAQFCEDPQRLASLMESLAEAERSHLTLPYLSALRVQILLPLVFGVGIFIQTYIMPTFIELFEGMNLTLPVTTKMLLATYSFLGTTKLDFVLILIFLYFTMAFTSEKSRRAVFQAFYYIPIAKNMVKLNSQSQLYRMVGAGLKFGVPLKECLKAAADNAQVRAYKKFLSSSAHNPTDSFAQRISQAPQLFSPHLGWLIEQGEELENLPEALLTASEVAHEEVDQKMRRVGVYLDTFILLAIGLYVGVTMVSLFVPLYQMIGHI